MEMRIGKEIDHIREMVIRMATLTEESVRDALHSFIGNDSVLAQSVIGRDSEINEMEMQIDKDVFECLALKAPVARDLRFLFSMQKINKDLERIGDHAVNIAQATLICSGHSQPVAGPDIKLMARLTQEMLRDAISSFITSDTQQALTVLKRDDQVDDLNRAMNATFIAMVKKDVTIVESALELLRVSRNLERIADLSTNIAEDVIFHTNAQDVKHHHDAH